MKLSLTPTIRVFLVTIMLVTVVLQPYSAAHASAASLSGNQTINASLSGPSVQSRELAVMPAKPTPRPTTTAVASPTPTTVKATRTPKQTATSTPSPTLQPTSTVEPIATTTTPEPTVVIEPTLTPAPTTATPAPTAVPVAFATAMPVDPASLQLTSTLNLKVNKTGIYRVTYEMLRDAGLDLAGVAASALTVINRDNMIPIYVYVGNQPESFGPGGFIEFYGEALDTTYTDTNVYTLQVSNTLTSQIPVQDARPDMQLAAPTSYTKTLRVNNQNKFANYAPGTEAWYDTSMSVTTASKSWDFTFQINGLVDAPAALELVVWGVTNWTANPDHHLVVNINGLQVTDQKFDGLVAKNFKIDLSAGVLREGTNTLQLTVPGDLGTQSDTIVLDRYSITYQQAFNAQNGGLSFTSLDDLFTVSNLPGQNVVAYGLRNGGLVRLGNIDVQPVGETFTANFAGTNQSDTFLLATAETLLTPVLEAARLKADLTSPAEYLVISHPDFISGLEPLVQARQAQGLTVSVVDVNDIYAQYSYGVFDAQAIKKYIAYAAQNLGTRYVLLVGGDTYDYRNYLGYNSISFIPSLYVATGPGAKFIAVDPLYADVDGNYVPDLAIGRFPVRTNEELSRLIGKTLAYANKSYSGTAVFASDVIDGAASFKNLSDKLATGIPSDWTVQSIHMDDLGAAAAKTQLLDAMNRGTALITYNGHSSPSAWSSLFTTSDVAALTNAGSPFVAVQWGCWNTYYVDPANDYLVQKFLLSGDNGAAAVLGGTTLIYFGSEEMFGPLLTPRLATPGLSVGQALQDAKAQLGQNDPGLIDVLLGWTLMGDPALIITP
ncbi:MAG: hypothetical protein CVU44_14730 [Chloroflexi bacterium HGW-Chloroflexi-6]|nr:MAG: hypothetical protein CVU44_14730 [Chloroflexi bacterium HGW-Chloroflexi-6]